MGNAFESQIVVSVSLGYRLDFHEKSPHDSLTCFLCALMTGPSVGENFASSLVESLKIVFLSISKLREEFVARSFVDLDVAHLAINLFSGLSRVIT